MILVTGGAGYIGSHTVIELVEAGYEVIVFDNFSNSSLKSIKSVEKILGTKIDCIEGDIRNNKQLEKVFQKYKIDSVIHFAGLKAVGESVKNPLKYYDNNIYGTITLCETMIKYECKSIVFSSSATVYGNSKIMPLKENSQTSATNPYGRSKLVIEEILNDLYISDNAWKIVILRYFNPVGAHESGQIGENPNGVPNNLMPYITQVAVKKLKTLNIFGDDYDTVDGTGVRDYIHVVDLAKGHVKSINVINSLENPVTVNLGTGKGYSVLEMVSAFKKVSNQEIPYKIDLRRAGDIAECYADASYAKKVLDWTATRDIEAMCRDSWRWQKNNPNGY